MRHKDIHVSMLRNMRTTVILPDELYRQVKARARDAGQTVTSFMETALRQEIRRRDASHTQVVDVVLAPATGGGGLLAGVDLADSVALLERMDASELEDRMP